MSFQITTAFVDQFRQNIYILAQQKGSKLRSRVSTDTLVGEYGYFDRIGATEARVDENRHGDSPLISTPHSRRRIVGVPYVWGDMIDKEDKVRTLIDPANGYVNAAKYSMGRGMDVEIITAATGNAYSGRSGGTAVPLPSGQVILNGGTNLNLEKLIQAKSTFGVADVDLEDPENKLYMVVSQLELDALLRVTEVKSADYNTVKALVQGDINTFMGFEFVRTQLLSKSGNIRRCIAYAKSGIMLAFNQDITVEIAKRPDKKFNWYAFASMMIGATRMEEEKVVAVDCDESVGS